MPCRSGDEDCAGESYRTTVKLDKLTRMLCDALTKLERTSVQLVRTLSLETQEWWAEHKEADRARIAEEERLKGITQAKAHALKKLTPKERKLLGL
jgi:hypothetical protein